MSHKRIPYQEGDWFAVPLRKGGFGIGLIARCDRKGGILGYLFRCKYEKLPTIDAAHRISSDNVALVRRFGDLGIIRGEWPIVGHVRGWDRTLWPVPCFGRIAADQSWATSVRYADDGITYLEETPITIEEAAKLPEDGLSGYGAIEIRLTNILAQLEQ